MRMIPTTPYWNPLLETMPREKLSELQLAKLKRVVRWGYERSKLYRRLYEEAGFHPEELKGWEDIAKVPMISKEHYRQAQAKEPWPYGEALCVPLEEVTEYHQTSGTTGQPVYQPDTWQDWEWWSECWSYILWAMGFRPTDRVFLPFGYNVFVAFWAGHYAAEKLGCEVVAGGILNTEERLLKIKELRATALMGTPTYMLNMAETCQKKLGFPARELGIKKIICAGEPGASVEGTKKRIGEAWGAEVFDHVGATEVGGWAYECTHHPGGVHVNEAMFLVELVDVQTNAPIEEPGKMGKIVLTAFDRQAQPCIRFDTKDLGMWAEDQCTCGRTFAVLKGGVLGRADHLTKVKGVLFSPLAVEEVVRALPELGDEYELVVTKKGEVDEIILKVELLPAYEAQKERVREELARQLRLKTNLNYLLEFHPPGSLPRYEQKAKRFKDLRPHA
ncbi:MAG: phenylacetate--CoA ligase family protein [Clostridia bacterium]|nr:phenylacetate--CoA ligase family protein [Clostridia bacterium]